LINEYHPLVSIIVITYNSSDYVLETLESAKEQSYKNIELIVTDDCSKDNTVNICCKWIEENNHRFLRTELISTEINSGIPANCNRGIRSSSGEWIKLIAGDDTLKRNCIADFIEFLNQNSRIVIDAIHSKMDVYKDSFIDSNYLLTTTVSKYLFNDQKIGPDSQYSLLLRDVFYIGAPSTFYSKRLLNRINSFDETMPYEDWPFYLNITSKGHKIHFLDKSTVNYRIHKGSIYNKKGCKQINDFFISDKMVYYQYRRPFLTLLERINEDFYFYAIGFLNKKQSDKESLFFKLVHTNVQFIYKKAKRIFRFILTHKITKKLNRK
jgi:glycosyltransferase involved in cell wall biosynthesis